jgi:hypothetical protein
MCKKQLKAAKKELDSEGLALYEVLKETVNSVTLDRRAKKTYFRYLCRKPLKKNTAARLAFMSAYQYDRQMVEVGMRKWKYNLRKIKSNKLMAFAINQTSVPKK